jgi:hypothetical protein
MFMARSEQLNLEERYLHLAIINIGEALSGISNLHLRGAVPGRDYATVEISLKRAIAAINGHIYCPPKASFGKDDYNTSDPRLHDDK